MIELGLCSLLIFPTSFCRGRLRCLHLPTDLFQVCHLEVYFLLNVYHMIKEEMWMRTSHAASAWRDNYFSRCLLHNTPTFIFTAAPLFSPIFGNAGSPGASEAELRAWDMHQLECMRNLGLWKVGIVHCYLLFSRLFFFVPGTH